MGIADAVLLIFLEQLTMTAVEAGGKIEIVKFSAEGFIFPGIPDFCQRLLFDIAEGAMGDLPAHIAHIGIAVVEQCHAGAYFAVSPDEGHAFPDEFAVAGFPQHRLVVEIEVEVLFPHQTADAIGSFGDVHIEVRQTNRRQYAALAG